MTQKGEKSGNELSLQDISPVASFIRECERAGTATEQQIRWWLRYRNENGLLASGAVVEKRANPKSRKPMLFIVRPRFIAWLANNQAAAC
jgi:hypothetical protein